MILDGIKGLAGLARFHYGNYVSDGRSKVVAILYTTGNEAMYTNMYLFNMASDLIQGGYRVFKRK